MPEFTVRPPRDLVGEVDGANRVFTAATAYLPGSMHVVLRGLLRLADDEDGWAETDPAAGVVTLAEAPAVGDPLPQGHYLAPGEDAVGAPVSVPIDAVLEQPGLPLTLEVPEVVALLTGPDLRSSISAPSLAALLTPHSLSLALEPPSLGSC